MSYYRPQTMPNNDERLNIKPLGTRYLYSSTPHFFTREELAPLKHLVESADPVKTATVADRSTGQQVHDQELRRSRVTWIEPSSDSDWLYHKIGDAIRYHNQTYYNYDLTGIEHLQYTEYHADEQGHYGLHMDWGAGLVMGRGDLCRKLSFSIQLSNEESYEGGEFEILDGKDFSRESLRIREFGTLITFPSWAVHQVKPVSRGVRRALVGWAIGPDFR